MLSATTQQLMFAAGGLGVGFLFGTLFGWFMRGRMRAQTSIGINGRRVAVVAVNVIIVVLWTASVTNTIFQFNTSVTPIFLHACMGAVIGYINENFGSWLLEMMGRNRNNITGIADKKDA